LLFLSLPLLIFLVKVKHLFNDANIIYQNAVYLRFKIILKLFLNWLKSFIYIAFKTNNYFDTKLELFFKIANYFSIPQRYKSIF
jgi:hypothetical protein